MELENTIDLADLLAVVIRSWKQIGITMLAFALLLGGYKMYGQIALANDPANSPESIEERYEIAKEDYEIQAALLQKTLESQEKLLDSMEEYAEKSILLQIDPYNKCTANIVFTFSNIDESAQLFRYPNTAADYLPKKIRSQYIELWNSTDVSRDIEIDKYADMEWKYLSELVSIVRLEGDLLSIQTVSTTETDAEELADAVYNYFKSHQDIIAAGSAQHDLVLVNRATQTVIDEDLNTKRENLEKEIEKLRTSIEKSRQAIEDLKEPSRETGCSITATVKTVVKYAVLGAAAGVFLACAVVCCWWIFAGRAAHSFQMEAVTGVPFLGSLRICRTLSERLASKVTGERSWREWEQAAAYIRQQAKTCFPEEGTVLLLSTLPERKAGAGMDGLVKVLSEDGWRVSPVLDAIHNPQAVSAVRSCAAVVFVEMAQFSSITAIRNMADQVKNAKKSILGIITV